MVPAVLVAARATPTFALKFIVLIEALQGFQSGVSLAVENVKFDNEAALVPVARSRVTAL
jgi:hypothetical protein